MRAFVLLSLVAACGRLEFDLLQSSDANIDATIVPAIDADDTPVFSRIYGVTYTTLHELDPTTFAVSATPALCPNQVLSTVTDIAFERNGSMVIATQQNRMYRAPAVGGDCTRLPDVPSNALAIDFVPRNVDRDRDMLVIGAADQNLYRFYDDNSLELVGPLGGIPAGDTAWTGTELLMSLEGGATDNLVRVDLATGAATTIGNLGRRIWGMSWFQSRLVGFASNGNVVEIDPDTAMTASIGSEALIWSGAGTAP